MTTQPIPPAKDDRFERIVQALLRALELPEAEQDKFLHAELPDAEDRAIALQILNRLEGSNDWTLTDIVSQLDQELTPTVLRNSIELNDSGRPGEIIGNFTLIERIDGGRGGFGVVWKAKSRTEPFHLVAMKLLRPSADSQIVRSSFNREWNILSSLRAHPNIVNFLLGDVENGRMYMVMEYLEGCDVVEYCVKNDLTVADRLRLFRQVCAAAEFAAQQGVCHRDISRSNVLVTDSTGTPAVKVIDFGIAKALGGTALGKGTLSDQFPQIGKYPYTAPELKARGRDGSATVAWASVDVYALCMLLLEMLVEQFPANVDVLNREALASQRQYVRMHHATKGTGQRVPQSLMRIIARGIALNSSKRTSTVSELIRQLEAYEHGEPIPGIQEWTAYLWIRYQFAHHTARAMSVALACLVVVAVAVTREQYLASLQVKTAEVEQANSALRAQRTELESTNDELSIALQTIDEQLSASQRALYRLALRSGQAAVADSDPLRARLELQRAPVSLRSWEWDVLWKDVSESIDSITPRQGAQFWSAAVTPEGVVTLEMVRRDDAETILIASHLPYDNNSREVLHEQSFPIAHAGLISDSGTRLITWAMERVVPTEPSPIKEEPRTSVRVFDLETGFDLSFHVSLKLEGSYAAASDSKGLIAFQALHPAVIHVVDSLTGDLVQALESSFSPVFSPSGAYLAVSSGNDSWIYSTENWDRVAGQTNGRIVAFSADETQVVVHMNNGSGQLIVRSLADESAIASITPSIGMVFDFAASDDLNRIAVANLDGAIEVFDLAENKSKTLNGVEGYIKTLEFKNDGDALISVASDSIQSWDTSFRDPFEALNSVSARSAPMFSACGNRMLVLTWNNYIDVFDTFTFDRVARLPVSYRYGAAEVPDGSTRWYGSGGAAMDCIDAALSPGGLFVAVAMLNSDVMIWSLQSGELVSYLSAGGLEPDFMRDHRVQWNRDGSRVSVTSTDNGLVEWDWKNRVRTRLADDSTRFSVLAHAYSPVDDLEASVEFSGRCVVTRSGNQVALLEFEMPDGFSPESVVQFSPDGTLLAAGTDATVHVWSTDTWEKLYSLEGHLEDVLHLSFSPDGSRIVTSSQDQTARVWDASTGAELLAEQHGWSPKPAWSPSGSMLALSHSRGIAIRTDVGSAGLLANADETAPLRNQIRSRQPGVDPLVDSAPGPDTSLTDSLRWWSSVEAVLKAVRQRSSEAQSVLHEQYRIHGDPERSLAEALKQLGDTDPTLLWIQGRNDLGYQGGTADCVAISADVFASPQALEWCTRSLKSFESTDPDSYHVQLALAVLHVRLGDIDSARSHLERADSVNDLNYSSILGGRAMLLQAKGLQDESDALTSELTELLGSSAPEGWRRRDHDYARLLLDLMK